jgi:hypothetical protein
LKFSSFPFLIFFSIFHRENCFNNEYFFGCVEALKLEDDWEKFEKWRGILGR